MTKGIERFKAILIGDLDNIEQITQERSEGQQIHPYAKHITRECTHIVRGCPADLSGIFILEESYYDYPDGASKIKPLLFFVEPLGSDSVQLHSMIIPDRLDPKEVINANIDLYFDYEELHPNPAFGAAKYEWQEDENCFKVYHPCDFGNGMTFTLIETLCADYLQVMELLKKDGQRLTPYDTPLIYKRMNP